MIPIMAGLAKALHDGSAVDARQGNRTVMKTTGPPYDLVAIGPRPPWITGQSLVTDALLQNFERKGLRIKAVNTAPRDLRVAWLRRVARIPRYLRALVAVSTMRKASWIYLSVDADAGTYPNILCALIAKLRGARLLAHHHSYSYVSRPARAARYLCRIAGPEAIHLIQCATVAAEMRAHYTTVKHISMLSNAFAVEPDAGAAVGRGGRVALGHLSNLTTTKGVLTVIDCFAELRRRGEAVELHLAGPIWESAVSRAIETARAQFGAAFRYHGPVQGAAKRAFFASIDVFLFPSVYKNELQPLAILEALAAAVPVIAFGRSCIIEDLDGSCGLAVPSDAQFQAAALDQITAWLQDRDALRSASDAARARFFELRDRSVRELDNLIERLRVDQSDCGCVGLVPGQRMTDATLAGFDLRTGLWEGIVGMAARAGEGTHRPHISNRLEETSARILPDPPGLRPLGGSSPPSEARSHAHEVIAIGPRLPYITGQSIATEAVLGFLDQAGLRVKAIDTAPGQSGNGLERQLRRLPRYLLAAITLATARDIGWFYLAVNANFGIYINVLLAALARMRGVRIIAHHHNYAYIAQRRRSLELLTRIMGPEAIHITLCDVMSRDLRQCFPSVRHTLNLSNICTLPRETRPRSTQLSRFTLGHLSNLCVQKGLKTVISCFRLLRRAGVDAALRLAGPAANREAAAIIEAAKSEFAADLLYDGPLYGEAKDEFYRNISVFLFPSTYRNEAQPIVLLEALAAGTPVISYKRGCIADLLSASSGVAICENASFEDGALPPLVKWATDRIALQSASLAARTRFEELREQGQRQLQALQHCLMLTPKASPSLGDRAVRRYP